MVLLCLFHPRSERQIVDACISQLLALVSLPQSNEYLDAWDQEVTIAFHPRGDRQIVGACISQLLALVSLPQSK